MKTLNISKSILSISTPGVHLVPGEDSNARDLARECNEFGADLKKRKPDKFGFLASLPLPDVEGSLTELTYAIDKLDADGVVLLSNTHGIYLGNPDLKDLFEELNRRSTIVMIHPTSPFINKEGERHTASPLPQYPGPVFEFFFDTARAVVDLFLSDTVDRYPNITWLISHAGGALPPLVRRFPILSGIWDPRFTLTPEKVKDKMTKQFYFDLAGFPFPEQIHGLLPFVSPNQLLYGSDFSFTPVDVISDLAAQMDDGLEELFSDEKDRKAVYSGNARRLFG